MKTVASPQQNNAISAVSNTSRKSGRLLVILCALAWGLSSCGDSSTGSNGGNGNGNGEIGPEPTFDNVQLIFANNCAPCHINSAQNGVRLNTYDNVMESVSSQYGANVVQPGDADSSPLVDKIESEPQFGERMPQGGPYLSSQRINQIREWINNGANNDQSSGNNGGGNGY